MGKRTNVIKIDIQDISISHLLTPDSNKYGPKLPSLVELFLKPTEEIKTAKNLIICS